MMHLIPLSREKVFEWIADGALVVDPTLKLIDFNQAAIAFFPELERRQIGSPIGVTLTPYNEFLIPLSHWHARTLESQVIIEAKDFGDDVFEFTLSDSEQQTTKYIKVRMKDLFDKTHRIGTTILLTDITKQKELMMQLEKIAQLDGLTGIYNRRHFIELVEREMRRMLRQNGCGVMVLFDIDYFKTINDQFGHQTGDFVLKELIQMTKNQLRDIDLIGRYGGEEFILFFPDTKINEAVVAAERIRSAFESTTIKWNGNLMTVTASFGVTSCLKVNTDSETMSFKTFDEMVKDADTALYRAKEEGRNKVCKAIEKNN